MKELIKTKADRTSPSCHWQLAFCFGAIATGSSHDGVRWRRYRPNRAVADRRGIEKIVKVNIFLADIGSLYERSLRQVFYLQPSGSCGSRGC